MRQVLSRHLGDFAALYDDDVELVSINRSTPAILEDLARQLNSERRELSARWTQSARAGAGCTAAARATSSAELTPLQLQALSDEVAAATDVLTSLLDCPAVGVRVSTLRRPMCPRFHVDQVPCRLLMAIDGPGTEWIPAAHVDRAALASPGADVPLRPGGEIRQFAAGSWSLVKGGAWREPFGGVVHRSPHTQAARLLITLDPLFSLDSADAGDQAGRFI